MTASSLGLEGLGDLTDLLETPRPEGAPREIALDAIDEDPAQPRAYFNPETLRELAETIRERGIKTPISLRPHPQAPGRYIINHGARRYRASRLAGKTSIPAFIDADYSAEDQIIENLHRDALTPREIAEFIGRLLAQGKKKSEIARQIGKSPAYITQHVALLDLPEPIADAFVSGRCRDVTVVNELLTAYRQNPTGVSHWLHDVEEPTRSEVKGLRHALRPAPPKKREKKKSQVVIRAEYEGVPSVVIVRPPDRPDWIWIEDPQNGPRQVLISKVRLVAIEEKG